MFAYSIKKREVLIIRVFVEAEFRERKGAISCQPAPFVNLVVYLQGHVDTYQTFCSFRKSLFFSPLKSSLAVSGLICRQVFGYLEHFDEKMKKKFQIFWADYVQCFAFCSVTFFGCVLIIDWSFACFPYSLPVYSNRFLIIYGLYTTCSYCFHVYVNFRCELFLTIEVKPLWPS